MKITTITVTAGRKINIGDYNSVHLEISISAELDASDDPDTARKQLWTEATASLKDQTSPFIKKRQAQLNEVFEGLPVDVQESIT